MEYVLLESFGIRVTPPSVATETYDKSPTEYALLPTLQIALIVSAGRYTGLRLHMIV